MSVLSPWNKVHGLYNLIGERGLYVNSNHDVYLGPHDAIKAGQAQQFEYRLLRKGGQAYASPLLLASLTSLLDHGTMLVTGAPGIGKTTGAEFAGHFFTGTPLEDILAATIQGHPQQTEEKMVARYHTGALVKEGEERVLPRKFMQCPVKLIDEINRLDPDKWSIILRLIDTGAATYGDELLKAAPGPLFATANYTDAGTFEMPPPGMDRFDVAAVVTSPQPWDLARIYGRADEKLNGGLQKLLDIPAHLRPTPDDFSRIRQEIAGLPKDGRLDDYLNFVLATIRFSEAASDDPARMTKGNAWSTQDIQGHYVDHPSTLTKGELSVRTARALQRYARALAWFMGAGMVEDTHAKTIFPYATWHKLQPSEKALQGAPKHANDRIAFARGLLGKIDEEWEKVKAEPVLAFYTVALNAIRTGTSDGKPLTPDQQRRIAGNAIEKLCGWDHPYALSLAKNIESEYNERVMQP
jgi:MoxR-like ATPase